MLPWDSIAALAVVFAPLVTWSFPVLRVGGFKFFENLIWWLAGLQSAALVTLWVGRFEILPFLFVYLAVMALFTFVRFQVTDDRSAAETPTMAEGFLASLVIVAIWVPANVFADVPRSIDALAYHLPMAAQWVQTGSMMATDSAVWFYPGGYELLTAVFFLIGKGDLLWFVPDLISWTLMIVSTHGLLRLLGVDRNASALMVGAFAMSPVIREHLCRGNNDLLVAALVVSAVTAFLRAEIQDNPPARAAGLVCLGAMVCVKYSVLPMILLLIPFVAIRRWKSVRPFGGLEATAMGATGVLLISFPLRNILLTGNPVFPVGLGGIFPWGDTSLVVPHSPAITPEQLKATALIHHPWPVWRVLIGNIWEWAAFLPVLAVLAVVLRTMKKMKWPLSSIDGLVWATITLAVASFITQPLVVANHPDSTNLITSPWALRFAVTWIVLLAAWFFSRIPERYSLPTAAILFLVSMVIQNLFQYAVVILGANLVLYLGGRFSGTRIIYGGILVPFALAAVILNSDHARPVQEANAYTTTYIARGDSRIANHVRELPDPQVIVLSGSLRAWPLIGHELKNRVVQVGMSHTAEKFRHQADLNEAGIIIVPKSIGENGWPYPEIPFEEMARLGRILGPEWAVGFEDSLVVAYTRVSTMGESAGPH